MPDNRDLSKFSIYTIFLILFIATLLLLGSGMQATYTPQDARETVTTNLSETGNYLFDSGNELEEGSVTVYKESGGELPEYNYTVDHLEGEINITEYYDGNISTYEATLSYTELVKATDYTGFVDIFFGFLEFFVDTFLIIFLGLLGVIVLGWFMYTMT